MELVLLLDRMDSRFDRMDSRFDRMDARMDARIEKSTNELKGYVDLKVGALDGKVGALGTGVKELAAKQEETGKAVVRAEALGAALALMGGAFGAFLSNAPQIKAFWSSV